MIRPEPTLSDKTDELLRDLVYRDRKSSSTVRTLAMSPLRWSRDLPSRFVGVDPYLLRRAGRRERITVDTLALAVLLTVSLAVMYGSVSWSYYRYGKVELRPGTIIAGVAVGIFIYIVERALLEMLSRDFKFAASDGDLDAHGLGDRSPAWKTFVRMFLTLLTRLAIALLIAAIVSDPLLLVIYEGDIDRVLQERRELELENKIQATETEFESRIESERVNALGGESEELLARRQELAVLESQRDALVQEAKDADASARRLDTLAECEIDGSTSAECQALLFPGETPLSGLPECRARCEGHKEDAKKQRAIAEAARTKLRDEVNPAIGVVEADIVALEAARIQDSIDELRFTLSDGSVSESPETARRDCEIVTDEILYQVRAYDDVHAMALFAFCEIDGPSTRDFVPYSGLQARQDAFAVLLLCRDPNGLRWNSTDPDEPLYCARAAGLTDDPTQTAPFPERGSYWSRATQPIRLLFDVPESTIGIDAARLRWLILTLDTLPVFLKFSLSLRRKRPYDALATLDKDGVLAMAHLANVEMRGSSPDKERRLLSRLQLMLSTSGKHLAGLVRRPRKPSRRKRPAADPTTQESAEVEQPLRGADNAYDPLAGSVVHSATVNGTTDESEQSTVAADRAAPNESTPSGEPSSDSDVGETDLSNGSETPAEDVSESAREDK